MYKLPLLCPLKTSTKTSRLFEQYVTNFKKQVSMMLWLSVRKGWWGHSRLGMASALNGGVQLFWGLVHDRGQEGVID